MRIAVLGWGSLVWNPDTLEIVGAFEPIGPRLPIEFCRISRDNRLTLVLSEAFGTRSVTYAAVSAFDDLTRAVDNLRVREGTTRDNIGVVVLEGGHADAVNHRHPSFSREIAAWAVKHDFRAVLWTALESNFAEKSVRGEAFSTAAAIRHLEGLSVDQRAVALHYIRRAPPEVQTPVRSAFNERWPEGNAI
jgi:hypothetical protein